MSDAQSLTSELATWIGGFDIGEMSVGARDALRATFANSVGTAIGGAEFPSTHRALKMATRDAASGHSTVLVHGQRLATGWAAYVNAVMMNALGQEETHVLSGTHPAETTVPLILALAERDHRSGRDALEAIAAGMEVAVAVASMSLTPAVKYELCEAPAVYGTIGAAAGAAKLLGLDERTTANALGLAANFSSGLAQCIREGTGEYHYLKGLAALHGYMAVSLASDGALGAARAFEGDGGFYRLFAGVSPEALAAHDVVGDVLGRLGRHSVAEELIYKPHPVHYFNQIFVDGALDVRKEMGAELERIERVVVEIGPLASRSGGDLRPPFHSQSNAVASTGFVVTASLLRGRLTTEETAEPNAPDILALFERTEIVERDALDTARIEVVASGKTFVFDAADAAHRYGSKDIDIDRLVSALTEGVLGASQSRALCEALSNIESVADVGEVMGMSVVRPAEVA